MNDRGGAAYLPLWQRQYGDQSYSSNPADWDIGNVRQIGWLSPSRQADKALGLSGRQLRKLRKRLRRKLT